MVKVSIPGSRWRPQYGRHSVVTGRSATSMPFKMRQYCLCSLSKIQVLWHDSKTMASTRQRWSDGLNPGVEEPGSPLRTSLNLMSTERHRPRAVRCRQGDIPAGALGSRKRPDWNRSDPAILFLLIGSLRRHPLADSTERENGVTGGDGEPFVVAGVGETPSKNMPDLELPRAGRPAGRRCCRPTASRRRCRSTPSTEDQHHVAA